MKKISEQKYLPQKPFKKFLYQKISQKKYTKEALQRHSLRKNWRDISTKMSLKRHFRTKKPGEKSQRKKHLKRNLYPAKWRNISTKRSEKKIIAKNMAKIRTDGIWWKNLVFIFHQFQCLPFFVSKKLRFFCGDFYCIEIVIGRDFFLDGLFGRNASSNIVW